MKKYDPNAKCPKCGCEQVMAFYDERDQLLRTCIRCLYDWTEKPLDAEAENEWLTKALNEKED